MHTTKNYIYHLIAILTVGIWGLTFISTKVLIEHGLSPQEIFLLRFLMAYLGIWFISPRNCLPIIGRMNFGCCRVGGYGWLVRTSDGKYGIGNYTGYQCGFHCLHGSVAHHYSVFADL